MILLDTDVLIDLLRKYPPAAAWFNTLHEDEELMVIVLEKVLGLRHNGASITQRR